MKYQYDRERKSQTYEILKSLYLELRLQNIQTKLIKILSLVKLFVYIFQ